MASLSKAWKEGHTSRKYDPAQSRGSEVADRKKKEQSVSDSVTKINDFKNAMGADNAIEYKNKLLQDPKYREVFLLSKGFIPKDVVNNLENSQYGKNKPSYLLDYFFKSAKKNVAGETVDCYAFKNNERKNMFIKLGMDINMSELYDDNKIDSETFAPFELDLFTYPKALREEIGDIMMATTGTNSGSVSAFAVTVNNMLQNMPERLSVQSESNQNTSEINNLIKVAKDIVTKKDNADTDFLKTYGDYQSKLDNYKNTLKDYSKEQASLERAADTAAKKLAGRVADPYYDTSSPNQLLLKLSGEGNGPGQNATNWVYAMRDPKTNNITILPAYKTQSDAAGLKELKRQFPGEAEYLTHLYRPDKNSYPFRTFKDVYKTVNPETGKPELRNITDDQIQPYLAYKNNAVNFWDKNKYPFTRDPETGEWKHKDGKWGAAYQGLFNMLADNYASKIDPKHIIPKTKDLSKIIDILQSHKSWDELTDGMTQYEKDQLEYMLRDNYVNFLPGGVLLWTKHSDKDKLSENDKNVLGDLSERMKTYKGILGQFKYKALLERQRILEKRFENGDKNVTYHEDANGNRIYDTIYKEDEKALGKNGKVINVGKTAKNMALQDIIKDINLLKNAGVTVPESFGAALNSRLVPMKSLEAISRIMKGNLYENNKPRKKINEGDKAALEDYFNSFSDAYVNMHDELKQAAKNKQLADYQNDPYLLNQEANKILADAEDEYKIALAKGDSPEEASRKFTEAYDKAYGYFNKLEEMQDRDDSKDKIPFMDRVAKIYLNRGPKSKLGELYRQRNGDAGTVDTEYISESKGTEPKSYADWKALAEARGKDVISLIEDFRRNGGRDPADVKDDKNINVGWIADNFKGPGADSKVTVKPSNNTSIESETPESVKKREVHKQDVQNNPVLKGLF